MFCIIILSHVLVDYTLLESSGTFDFGMNVQYVDRRPSSLDRRTQDGADLIQRKILMSPALTDSTILLHLHIQLQTLHSVED